MRRAWCRGPSYALQSLETTFQQDLNGDGTTGLKTTPIETSGATRLDQVANEFFLHDSAGIGPSLKYQGHAVTVGQFGGLGADRRGEGGSGYQVVWKNGARPVRRLEPRQQRQLCQQRDRHDFFVRCGVHVLGECLPAGSERRRSGACRLRDLGAGGRQGRGQSGTTPFTFTITRTGDTGSAHSVSWSLTGSGANPASASDFVGNALPSGTVSFAAGETSKTITVNVAGDTVVESDRGLHGDAVEPEHGGDAGHGVGHRHDPQRRRNDEPFDPADYRPVEPRRQQRLQAQWRRRRATGLVSVASAGDVNGDGFADLIVGALGSNAPGLLHSGASYVVFGKASGFAANFDLSSLDGSNGFKLSGVGRSQLERLIRSPRRATSMATALPT